MKSIKRLKLLIIVSIIILGIGMNKTLEAQVKIGVFADCQYCDCEPTTSRYYRNSLEKLKICISEFNNEPEIEFVVGLGDLIDRDYFSYNKVNAILAKSNKNIYQISGNHDYSVDPEYFDEIPNQLGLKNTYYSVKHKKWQFIFLDGNDITFSSNNKETVKQAKEILDELTQANQPNNHDWNGGIGQTQIEWLKSELKNAKEENLNVVLFCHYPLLPLEAHALWNSTEILSILNQHDCVKAWINGHNHAGAYAQQNGIHFITMKGMVDTKTENAYSMLSFSEKEIAIKGYGREESKSLVVK